MPVIPQSAWKESGSFKGLSPLNMYSLCSHAYTLYLFTCNNISAVICPSLLFGSLNAFIASKLDMGKSFTAQDVISSIPAMLLWSWVNLLFFNLSNQHQEGSIAEDAVNTPWRPLPSRRLSPAQAKRLFHYMYPIVILVSLMIGGTVPSLAIMCLPYWYDKRGGASNPWVKNVINGLGIGFFFTGPLEVITGHSIFSGTGDGAIWVAIIMATIASTSHAQDLRDVEGDKAAGRETLPIAIGDTNARMLATIGIMFWTWFACWYWSAGWIQGATAGVAGVVMSANMFRDRTREGDIITWKFFPWWMLGVFLIPILSQ